MSSLTAISKIGFPFRIGKEKLKKCAQELFEPSFPQVIKNISAFDNTEIKTRNFCKPLDYYTTIHSFQNQSEDYIHITPEYSVKAIEECIAKAKIIKEEINDIIFLSATGLEFWLSSCKVISKKYDY